MLGALTSIVGGIQWLADNIVTLIYGGIVDVANAFFLGVSEFLSALLLLLPTIPAPPSFTGDQWVGWLNWFLPITALLAGATAALVTYVSYLAVRWMLNMIRAL